MYSLYVKIQSTLWVFTKSFTLRMCGDLFRHRLRCSKSYVNDLGHTTDGGQIVSGKLKYNLDQNPSVKTADRIIFLCQSWSNSLSV